MNSRCNSQAKKCQQERWYEFRVPTNHAAPSLIELSEGQGRTQKTIAAFPNVSLDLSQPQDVRITYFKTQLLISLLNDQRLCVPITRPGLDGFQVGLSWYSTPNGKGITD